MMSETLQMILILAVVLFTQTVLVKVLRRLPKTSGGRKVGPEKSSIDELRRDLAETMSEHPS